MRHPALNRSFGLRIAVALVLAVALAGCRFPRDILGTLDRVEHGRLDVGVTENPPWVVDGLLGPRGLEVDMVRELARELGAEIRWHWGTEGQLAAALQAYQLDLVIGGVEAQPWLREPAALSRPFFRDQAVVGFPPGQLVPESLEDVRVAVPAVNDLGYRLRQRGAKPVRMDRPPPDMPVAGALWWIRSRGYTPGPWPLRTMKHVWLLPHGENAWILRVERHLARYQALGEQLRAAGDER